MIDFSSRAIGPLPPEVFQSLSGLETLRRMIAGELPAPPISRTMNFILSEVEMGKVVFVGEPREDVYNPLGTVHGGWAATILDSALGCAVHTTIEAGERYTTVEMKVNYLRPIFPGKPAQFRCEGSVINRGRTLALSEARLVDDDGKVYAHGTETCMIFPKA